MKCVSNSRMSLFMLFVFRGFNRRVKCYILVFFFLWTKMKLLNSCQVFKCKSKVCQWRRRQNTWCKNTIRIKTICCTLNVLLNWNAADAFVCHSVIHSFAHLIFNSKCARIASIGADTHSHFLLTDKFQSQSQLKSFVAGSHSNWFTWIIFYHLFHCNPHFCWINVIKIA